MLIRAAIEKAIEIYDGGATESVVAKGAGISPDEARPIAEAHYLRETDRLLREVALAGVVDPFDPSITGGRAATGWSVVLLRGSVAKPPSSMTLELGLAGHAGRRSDELAPDQDAWSHPRGH